MSRKLPSHNKSPPYKQSLDSTTTSEFSSSVRSDHVPSRPFQPAQKRYNSSKDIQEMKENDISLSNDQKNVAQLDTHSENGKIKSRKCVLQEKERIDPKLVENKHDQKNMMPRDYDEHSIFNVNANTGPKLPSFSLESSTTSSILKEETHSNFRQITVSEAPKDERTSTPISPKKDKDHFADKIGNVRTVFCDAETMKLDSVSITEVENNVTHEGTKQEESEHEGEISDKKDANQNVQETTSSHHGNTHKTDEAQEIIKLPNILYADLSQTNAALTDKRLIKTEKSDIVAATKVDTTGEEQSDTKSNSESEISVTSNTEKEKTPTDKYEDKLWNSFGDAKEQQKENTSFEEGVIRDDEIKEAKQDKDVIIEKNNVKDDDKSTEEEYNYRKHSQDMSEKLTEDVNHEVNLLGAEDNIPSDHCANETSNWSRTLKQETSFSDNERNETVTEQHISSGLSEDSLSRLANQKRQSLTLSDNNTDKTDSTVTEVNNKPSSETEQVKVLTAIHSSVVDLSDDEYSDMSSSEDDISEGNVSDVTGGQIENIENTRSGMPDENTLVEDPRTKNAEKVTSIQEENEHVKPDVDISDAIIHDPKTLDDVTNDIDPTVVTEYNNADLSVQFKHKNPEKCEKELLLEQKSELEPHSVKDSETRNKSHETEEQTTEMEIPKETRTDAIVGVLQKANEESNVMHVNNLEKQEWQEERSEELVEKIAEERSLGLENGTVSDKDVLYSEIQVNMNLQDETDEPLRKEKETIKLNLESELTVSTHAETDIEIKSHSIKDSETRKSPETEDQTTEMEIPKETGTVVTGEILKDSDEQSDIMNVNNLEIQEWQEEKSEEFVEVIAEERSLRLESGNVSDKDAVYCETQAKVNLHYETDEPLTKAEETVALNQELVLTMSTQAETYAETKPMDSSTNISGIGTHRRTGTSESPVPDPDTNEGQSDISKEIKEPSISEEHDRMTVKENGQHIETQTVLDEENILATKKLEESPNVSESEIERDSIYDNEIPGCRQNDTESYAKPESLNFDHTISMSTEDSKAEEIEHSTTQAEQLNFPDNGDRNLPE